MRVDSVGVGHESRAHWIYIDIMKLLDPTGFKDWLTTIILE